MRDAFGGVFMFRLMLVFIVIYVAFTAISLKYAKSFRIKNQVIDFVEQNQITTIKGLSKVKALDGNLKAAGYNISCKDIGYKNGIIDDKDTGRSNGYCYNGIVITKNEAKSTNDTIHYNIYTYVDWNLGIMNTILALGGENSNSEKPIVGTWKISGEAIVVNK